MSSPEVAVGAVCTHLEQLLLVRRGRGAAQGQWSVPGGRVEWGETLHEAVVRETFEETGLEVVVDRYLGWVERIHDPYHYVILDYLARVVAARWSRAATTGFSGSTGPTTASAPRS